ncbi:MAG: response regulator [Bacteroidetes bacterium]|nr:response regulator [Bacteroidota bacterium]MBK9799849.1 response regulator [Bacteroidota bacterium]MBP6412854.1 response regulator [Bacteroidia bacterium]
MDKPIKILFIEDSPHDVELIQRELRRASIEFSSYIVQTRIDFIYALEKFTPDLILSDFTLPQFNSLEALNILKQNKIAIPFVNITGAVAENFIVESIRAGADDYILKTSLNRLSASVLNIFENPNYVVRSTLFWEK